MEKREFFEYWTEAYRLTKATIERFPEEDLMRTIVPGLRPPGLIFAHIYAHVNGMFNACVRRELIPDELNQLPEGLDTSKTASLLRYASRTMEELLAHGSVDDQVWKQKIVTPWGEVPMEQLCIRSFAHEIHHRGQLFVMLRMVGGEPPEVCRHG